LTSSTCCSSASIAGAWCGKAVVAPVRDRDTGVVLHDSTHTIDIDDRRSKGIVEGPSKKRMAA
jgi:hypothetical protein